MLFSDARSGATHLQARTPDHPPTHPVLFIAIPVHNEVETVGVLLWRLRSVLAEFPREYEVVVYDDASSDDTLSLLEGYEKVLPLTILRGERQVGYAKALDVLLRHVVRQTRHPRRDAVLLLQGDFTDPPGLIPEFARHFEGGADIVVGERTALADAPKPVQRLFRLSSWSMRPFVRINGLQDVTSSLRLIRIAVVRDLLQQRGDAPLSEGDSWTANADLLLGLVPFARRIESVPVQSTYGVRVRDTRRVAARDAIAALKWAWRARTRRVRALVTEPDTTSARTRDEARLTVSRGDGDDRGSRSRRRNKGNSARGRNDPRRARAVSEASASPIVPSVLDSEADRAAEPRRRKRKRPTPRLAPDATEETLSLVDPAAGIAADMDLPTPALDDARLEADKRRRRKRRRRKRVRDAAGDIAANDADETDAPEVDAYDASTSDESADNDNHLNDGEEAFPELQEGAGAEVTRRRRGRRGKRGGRRTRRNRPDGDNNEPSTDESGAPDAISYSDYDNPSRDSDERAD